MIANLLDKKLDETYMSDENNDRIKNFRKKIFKRNFLGCLPCDSGVTCWRTAVACHTCSFGLCSGLCGNCSCVCIYFCNLSVARRLEVMDPWIVCNYNILYPDLQWSADAVCFAFGIGIFTCDTYDLSL